MEQNNEQIVLNDIMVYYIELVVELARLYAVKKKQTTFFCEVACMAYDLNTAPQHSRLIAIAHYVDACPEIR